MKTFLQIVFWLWFLTCPPVWIAEAIKFIRFRNTVVADSSAKWWEFHFHEKSRGERTELLLAELVRDVNEIKLALSQMTTGRLPL